MITEYIKRGYKKGYDEQGNLVYKIPVDEVFVPTEEEEQQQELELDDESVED